MKFSENTEGDSDPKTGNTCNALSGRRQNLPLNPRQPGGFTTSRSPSLSCRCLLWRVQHLQFLGGESRGRRPVPGGAQLQCDLAAAAQHATAQPEPTAAQPAGHSPGPAAEAAQQVRRHRSLLFAVSRHRRHLLLTQSFREKNLNRRSICAAVQRLRQRLVSKDIRFSFPVAWS